MRANGGLVWLALTVLGAGAGILIGYEIASTVL
jgi:hypothetical protein